MEDLHHHQVQERICNKALQVANRYRKRGKFPMDQVTLRGVNIGATDREAFGHFYPKYPSNDCLIITFVNAGQMPKTVFKEEGKRQEVLQKLLRLAKPVSPYMQKLTLTKLKFHSMKDLINT